MSAFLAAGAITLMAALTTYAIRHDLTNVAHLQSFTPICPNCERPIPATSETANPAKVRLRDHLKRCEG